ncbi:putative secreted protein [[Actinomadura] parvosata subsp. kistnae]|uniref:discoidin domain-containing protein n=1 Tax=[Actinomadura] parvosata TaxID=1955412 RepID=UPI000D273C5C|nr:putative secreted protein [Actinomadura parvosata subsp. kistnae]
MASILTIVAALALPPAGAAAAADPLVSQGKAVTASSVEAAGLEPGKAVDGSTATRWASAEGVDPQWIRVDLGSAHTLSRVRLTWEAAYATAYRVQTSPDGSAWTDVYSTTTGDGGVDDLTISGSGRYVRVHGTQRGTPTATRCGSWRSTAPPRAAAAARRCRPTGSCASAVSSCATRTASRSSCAA